MICSICKKGETSVVDSRPTEDGTAIRRRRLCVCGARFTTFERVQYRELMVVKKMEENLLLIETSLLSQFL
jgi:transcriptional repressor NrdR